MTTQEVKQLQDYLVQQGYMTQEEANTGPGVFGPRTTAAYNKYLQAVSTQLSSNEKTASLISGGTTAEDILNAYTTGDWSSVKSASGQPFSEAEQQEAVDKATKALEPYYTSVSESEKADTESQLKKQQLDYQKELADKAVSFGEEKGNLETQMSDQGVLFSGANLQKQKALRDKYQSDADYLKSQAELNIGDIARNYQTKEGSEAAGNLSQYYNLPTQQYGSKVTSGETTPVYNPTAYNLGIGTNKTSKLSDIYSRATNLLKNKTNKLTIGGYANKL